ncbi:MULTISPECIES: DNA adenine methylase [Rhodococcus]|uniref:DNA adenine methylase n=1 Tax=Rhodococcus TaxID=1827 RepID=UPI001E3DA80E|nr:MULTISPECIES: DNA adenine methylase [Rhodococcus]BDB59014.1 SAM-dependent methyltransferase [Rhodococcus sp. RDE2]
MMSSIRPPFPYFGGKQSLAATIATALPPHRHYIEPFAGSLAVLLAKKPSPAETVNDVDHALMTFWRILRDRPAELAVACEFTPHARHEHATALTLDLDGETDELEIARRVWVVLSQGRTSTLRPTGWRHDTTGPRSTSMPGRLDGYRARLLPAAERIRNVSLECRDGIEMITAYGQGPDSVLYVDPPYLRRVRTSNYRREMGSVRAHEHLAAELHDCTASVVLSGYPDPLYDDMFRDWNRYELDAYTTQGITGTARTEVLWSNRPLALDQPNDLFSTIAAEETP